MSQLSENSLLGLRCLYALISLVIVFMTSAGVPLAIILMTYRADMGINSKDIFLDTKKIFGDTLGKPLLGHFWHLFLHFPLFVYY